MKVQNYIKNLGKSIKYAGVDVLAEMAPSTTDFITTNTELFKEIDTAIRDHKAIIGRTKTAIKRSKVYEAADQLKTSLFEDIMTGNLYNKERKEKLEARALGMEMDEMDIGSDMDFDDFNPSESDSFLDNSIESNAKAASTMISSSIARSTEYIVTIQGHTPSNYG